MSKLQSILVTGTTGNQGGAVVDALLEADLDVEIGGLTRDASSDRARALADQGVEMVEGDLEDPSSLERALDGYEGIFGVTNFWDVGYDRQVEQGCNLVDAAFETDSRFFVFSGVGSHHENTGIPHFDSSWEIDQHLQGSGLDNTVLEPVFFFQNFEPSAEDILGGTLAQPLAEGVSLQMIDVRDVGRAAERVFANPGDFEGQRLELAGDEATLEEMAETFSEVTGVEVAPYHVSIEEAREQFGDEFADMFEWFNEAGYSADIDRLEQTFGLEFNTLETYLHEQGWGSDYSPDEM
ncbi:MAG: NmrA/HSCARG family protein, partial [Bradymonadaceae bacterium]